MEEISLLTSDRKAQAAAPLQWDTLLAHTKEDAIIGRQPPGHLLSAQRIPMLLFQGAI